MSNLKVALCAIGRRENQYAKEWVEHYLKLGVDHIFIIDNNYDNEEHFEDVLQDYIVKDLVTIEDCRNQANCQMRAYTKLYNKIKDDYDAVAVFDFDEELVLENDKTIQSYIERFPSDWEAILINWDTKTDSNLVHYDSRPLIERFTESLNPIDKCVQYDNIPENAHIKAIIKGGLDNVLWYGNPHICSNPLVCYSASGRRCNQSPFQPIDYSMARLLHFTTKTASEYCKKLEVGTPDRTYDVFLKTYVGRFFKYNERTDEKVKIFEEKGYRV